MSSANEESRESRGRLVLHKKDCSLLNASQLLKSIPEFEWFFSFLIDKDRVKEEDLENLNADRRKDFVSVAERLLKAAVQEWIGDDSAGGNAIDYREEPIPCSLCGTPNNHIYYIVNVHNQNVRLNVGGDCFGKFDFDLGMDEAQKLKSRKSAVRLRSEIQINKEINGITSIVESLNRELDNLAILIPKKARRSYDKQVSVLKLHYNRYLEGKRGKTLQYIHVALQEFEIEREQIRRYVEIHRNDDHVISVDLAAWAKKNCPREYYVRMMDNGYVDGMTSLYLHKQEYMDTLVPKYNQLFSQSGIQVLYADEQIKGYVLGFAGTDIKFRCSHKNLISSYGYSFYGRELDEEVNKIEVFRHSYPSTSSDLNNLYNELLFRFNKIIGYNMIYFDEASNELVIKKLEKGEPRYWFENLRRFINQFKFLIFSKERFFSEELQTYLKSYNGATFDSEDMEDQCKRRDWDIRVVLG